jgi:hypothetical protein
MIGKLVVKPVPVHPRDRIDVDPEGVVDDREGLYKPLLVVESAMGNAHVDDGRQIQPPDEPARKEIGGADQQPCPGADVRRGEIQAAQRIDENNRVTGGVVDLHAELPSDVKIKRKGNRGKT